MKFFKFCSISNYSKVRWVFLLPSESEGVSEHSSQPSEFKQVTEFHRTQFQMRYHVTR